MHSFTAKWKVSILKFSLHEESVITNMFKHCIGLLRKEVDKVEWSQYVGIECDSDLELEEDESDAEYVSEDEATRRKPIDYELDTMFEIVKKRDFNNWSMPTIHSRYKKISDGTGGRMQMTR